MGVSPIGHRTAQGSLYGKGCTIIYAIHSFFLLLAPIGNISDDTLQSLSAFPTGIITDQHLLVQNSLKIHFFLANTGLLCTSHAPVLNVLDLCMTK